MVSHNVGHNPIMVNRSRIFRSMEDLSWHAQRNIGLQYSPGWQ
jgi:hypothetical protein